MTSLILAFLIFAFGYSLGRWGWDNMKAWAVGAAALVASYWESVTAFFAGLVG